MVKTVYTIGYAGFSIPDFLDRLHSCTVNVLIDVRTSPFSTYRQNYNRDILEPTLHAQGIYYRNYARQFGARQSQRCYYGAGGYLDFEVFAHSDAFQNGLGKICLGMEQGYCFALMCAEIEPIECHRAILVARSFADMGYQVIHLLPKGLSMTHQKLERQLLDMYFPDRDQYSLFTPQMDESELLKEAYRKRNAEIGYHLQEYGA